MKCSAGSCGDDCKNAANEKKKPITAKVSKTVALAIQLLANSHKDKLPPAESDHKKKEGEKKSLPRRVSNVLLEWFLFCLLAPSILKMKCRVRAPIANKWADFFAAAKGRQKAGLVTRIRFWFWMNFVLMIFDCYLKENDLSLEKAHHAYDISWRFLKSAVLCNAHPELAFKEMIDFVTDKRKDHDWKFFDSCHGGIFTPEVTETITTVLQFNKDDEKVLLGVFRSLTADVPREDKDRFRKFRDKFIEKSGYRELVDAVNGKLRQLLRIYCEKMKESAKKSRNNVATQKWTYALQKLDIISCRKPIPSTEREISVLVQEFTERCNEAASYSYAARQIDIDINQDDPDEVSVKEAAASLGIKPREIYRWEEDDPEHPCPVPGYSRILRKRRAAFESWAHIYLAWKATNKKNHKRRAPKTAAAAEKRMHDEIGNLFQNYSRGQ